MKFFIPFVLVVAFVGEATSQDLKLYQDQLENLDQTIEYFEIEKVNDQFYMLVGGGGNVGVYVSDTHVVLIDNKYEIIEDVLMNAVRSITDKPIKYIVNTHFHHDHSDGNRSFGKQGIPIISHENAKERMKSNAQLYGGIYESMEGFVQPKYSKEALPVMTYKQKMTLSEGAELIELYHFGKAHTDGDTLVFFKNANIVHTGDAFVRYGYPYVDLNNGGSIKGIISLLGSLESLIDDQTIIMPGHGQLSSKSDVISLKNLLEDLYTKTVQGMEEGLKVDQIEASIAETINDDKKTKLNYIKSIVFELRQ